MSRVSHLLTAALLSVTAGFAAPASADQRPVVVELYTSQGCSSCPPADSIFGQLEGRDDVIAIAMHVDYWDYIGWKDEFGHPDHAVRQRAYAQNAGRRSIYTPEMVVNGVLDIVGAKPMVLADAIAQYRDVAPKMTLEGARQGETLRVQGSKMSGGAKAMDVYVLRIMPKQSTKITRGENRGKTFEYSNIAHDWQMVGTWNGTSPLDMTVTVTGTDPVVVLVQEANVGPIVAAARFD